MNSYYHQHLLDTATLTAETLLISRVNPNAIDVEHKRRILAAIGTGDLGKVVETVQDAVKAGVSTEWWQRWANHFLGRVEYLKGLDVRSEAAAETA